MKHLGQICILLLLGAIPTRTAAQLHFVKNGAFYFSWGYNTEYYSKSDLYISQPELNSNYVFKDISAKDHIGWDRLFQSAISIPQYNYRLGYFFNEKQDLGFEINFDHTKYIVKKDQTVLVTGIKDGQQINSPFVISDSVLIYFLNNGANFLLFNLVKKWDVYTNPSNNFKISGLLKGGIGPVVPHVENVIFGNRNQPHFQVGGWNTGLEAALKITLFNHVFLEICNKLDYARYSHLGIYKGLARQSFFTYEIIGNLGYTFSCGKKTN
jgi:hypothetical protein